MSYLNLVNTCILIVFTFFEPATRLLFGCYDVRLYLSSLIHCVKTTIKLSRQLNGIAFFFWIWTDFIYRLFDYVIWLFSCEQGTNNTITRTISQQFQIQRTHGFLKRGYSACWSYTWRMYVYFNIAAESLCCYTLTVTAHTKIQSISTQSNHVIIHRVFVVFETAELDFVFGFIWKHSLFVNYNRIRIKHYRWRHVCNYSKSKSKTEICRVWKILKKISNKSEYATQTLCEQTNAGLKISKLFLNLTKLHLFERNYLFKWLKLLYYLRRSI